MHRFSQVDVFTDRLTTGNPLAPPTKARTSNWCGLPGG